MRLVKEGELKEVEAKFGKSGLDQALKVLDKLKEGLRIDDTIEYLETVEGGKSRVVTSTINLIVEKNDTMEIFLAK